MQDRFLRKILIVQIRVIGRESVMEESYSEVFYVQSRGVEHRRVEAT